MESDNKDMIISSDQQDSRLGADLLNQRHFRSASQLTTDPAKQSILRYFVILFTKSLILELQEKLGDTLDRIQTRRQEYDAQAEENAVLLEYIAKIKS